MPRERAEAKTYWGYRIKETSQRLAGGFGQRKDTYTVIATSRLGRPYNEVDLPPLSNKPVLFVFGSPKKGLYDFLKGSKLRMSDVAHAVVNTVPNPGTRTVRLEEAITVTLARLLPHYGWP